MLTDTGDNLSHCSSGPRNWLTKCACIWEFKVVLWTRIKHTLTSLRFGYLFCLWPHLKHICRVSAVRGGLLPSLLPAHRLPAVCWDALSPLEAGNCATLRASPCPHPLVPAPTPMAGLGLPTLGLPWAPGCHRGLQGTRVFCRDLHSSAPWRPLYFPVNELKGPLTSW